MLRNLLEMKSQSDEQRWPGYWPGIRAELNKMLAAEISPPKEAAARSPTVPAARPDKSQLSAVSLPVHSARQTSCRSEDIAPR
jgi:hypothetical protein